MTNKQQEKVWQKALNQVKEGNSPAYKKISDFYQVKHELVDHLNTKKQDILNHIPLPKSEHHLEVEKYKSNLVEYMDELILKKYRNTIRPRIRKQERKHEKHLEECSKALDILSSTIESKTDEWETTMDEWGGAKVIVTGDPERRHEDYDLFLVLKKPKPLIWLMLTIRDMQYSPAGLIDKYSLYGGIAEMAADHIKKHGEPNSIEEWVNLLRNIIDSIRENIH